MSKNKHNTVSTQQEIPAESIVPSIEQVKEVTAEKEDIKEESVQEENVSEEEVERTNQDESYSIESVSIEMGFKEEPVQPNPNDVRFKVKYKNIFEGVKRHNEGDVLIISRESAEMFEQKGIGHIIK